MVELVIIQNETSFII